MMETVLRRTVAYIEEIEGTYATVTVAGVDLPPGSTSVPVTHLPPGAEAGKVFFAWANLNAESSDQVGLCQIEPEWGQMSRFDFEESEE